MKPLAHSAQRPQSEKPFRPQSAAGLYGEVLVLPLNRSVAAPAPEPKSFL